MSLTINEARERAEQVWGAARVRVVRKRVDGGADVECQPQGIASDVRERNYVAHRLDANGHVSCHTDCEKLEAEHV